MPSTPTQVITDTKTAAATAPVVSSDTKTDRRSDAKTDAKTNGNTSTALVAVTSSAPVSTTVGHKAVTVTTKEDIDAILHPTGRIETTRCKYKPEFAADFKIYGGEIHQKDYSQKINSTLSKMSRNKSIYLINGAYNFVKPLQITGNDIHNLVLQDIDGYNLDLNKDKNTENLEFFLQRLINLRYLQLDNLSFYQCNLGELLKIITRTCPHLQTLEIANMQIKVDDLKHLVKNAQLKIVLDVADYVTITQEDKWVRKGLMAFNEGIVKVKKYPIPLFYNFYKEICGTNITLEITDDKQNPVHPTLSHIKSWAEEELELEKQIMQLVELKTYKLSDLHALTNLVTRCLQLVTWQLKNQVIDEPKSIDQYRKLFRLLQKIRGNIDNSVASTDKLAIYKLLINYYKQLQPHFADLQKYIDECLLEIYPIRLAIFQSNPTLANFQDLAGHFQAYLQNPNNNTVYTDTIESIKKMSPDDQLSAFEHFPQKQKSPQYYVKYFELNIVKFEQTSENKFFEQATTYFHRCSTEKQNENTLRYYSAKLQYAKNVAKQPITNTNAQQQFIETIKSLENSLKFLKSLAETPAVNDLCQQYSAQIARCHLQVVQSIMGDKHKIVESFRYLCGFLKTINNPDLFSDTITAYIRFYNNDYGYANSCLDDVEDLVQRKSGIFIAYCQNPEKCKLNYVHILQWLKKFKSPALLIAQLCLLRSDEEINYLLTNNIFSFEDLWGYAQQLEKSSASDPVILNDCHRFYYRLAVVAFASGHFNYENYGRYTEKLATIPTASDCYGEVQQLIAATKNKIKSDMNQKLLSTLINTIAKTLTKDAAVLTKVAKEEDVNNPVDPLTTDLLRDAKQACDNSDLNGFEKAIEKFENKRGKQDRSYSFVTYYNKQQANRSCLTVVKMKIDEFKGTDLVVKMVVLSPADAKCHPPLASQTVPLLGSVAAAAATNNAAMGSVTTPGMGAPDTKHIAPVGLTISSASISTTVSAVVSTTVPTSTATIISAATSSGLSGKASGTMSATSAVITAPAVNTV